MRFEPSTPRLRCGALAAALWLASAAVLGAQTRTWIVDEALGAGAHFRDLPQAVTAASTGDVLRVRAGSYTGFTTAKGLALFAEPGALAVVEAPLALAAEAVNVRGLPFGARFALSGFTVLAPVGEGVALRIEDALGEVCIEHCVLEMRDVVSAPDRRAAADVRRSPRVTFAHSRLLGAPALLFEDAEGAVVDCALRGAMGTSPLPGVVTHAGSAVLGRRARLELSRCELRGGDRTGLATTWPAGAAIQSDASEWILRGDGVGGGFAGGGASVPSSAVRGTGAVSADPSVLFVAAGGAPAVEPGLTRLQTELPALRAELRRELQLAEIELRGPAAALFALWLGVPGTPVELPGLGRLRLDPAQLLALFAAGSLDATGRFTAAPAVPGDPALVGVRVGFQAVRSTSTGFALSNLAAFVLG